MLQAVDEMAKAEAEERYEDAEIVCDHGECWLGHRRVSYNTVYAMLRLCLVSFDGGGGCEHYTLNQDGRDLAKNHEHVPRIIVELRKLRKGHKHVRT